MLDTVYNIEPILILLAMGVDHCEISMTILLALGIIHGQIWTPLMFMHTDPLRGQYRVKICIFT